jgi:adenosylcobinamide-phosphate synthase
VSVGDLLRRRASGVAAGLLLDRLLGEPPTPVHPVAWFGTAMGAVERRTWADSRPRGVGYTATGVLLGLAAGRAVPGVAVAVAVASAGRALREASVVVEDDLARDDLAAARHDLRALAGRDATSLDVSAISAAVVESLAENSVDAVVAPVLWALVGGAPGALAHRAVNTMDAMVGHRTERFERFGWSAARLDDVANYLPARLFALLVVAARPSTAARVVAVVRRDAGAHPSPNAGVAEAAVAAALGVELGGPLRYGERHEERPRLGGGPRPQPGDIARARRLVDRTEWLLVAGLVVTAAGRPGLAAARDRWRRGRAARSS